MKTKNLIQSHFKELSEPESIFISLIFHSEIKDIMLEFCKQKSMENDSYLLNYKILKENKSTTKIGIELTYDIKYENAYGNLYALGYDWALYSSGKYQN